MSWYPSGVRLTVSIVLAEGDKSTLWLETIDPCEWESPREFHPAEILSLRTMFELANKAKM